MSWWEYVKRTAGTDVLVEIVERTDIKSPTLSRWRSGKQGVDPTSAAQFARAYDVPVLEAFVAAGFLTADEAKVRPSAAPDFTRLTNDELLELVRARMIKEAGEGHAGPAATKEADSGRHLSSVDESDPSDSLAPAALDAIEGVDQPPGEPEG